YVACRVYGWLLPPASAQCAAGDRKVHPAPAITPAAHARFGMAMKQLSDSYQANGLLSPPIQKYFTSVGRELGKIMLNMNHNVKRSLARLGGIAPVATTRSLRRAADLIDTARWLREHSMLPFKASFPRRESIFNVIADATRERQVLYLEFGVF